MTDTAVQRAVDEFAQRVGEDSSKIDVLDVNIEQLMMKGAVIRLKTGGYEGTTQITPQDMGWDEASMSEVERLAIGQLFRELGKRPLVKPSIIQESKSIRNSARADIERLTFRLFDGETRFVPEGAYNELVDKLAAHQKRYFELRDDLIANLDSYREALRPDYEIWVRRLYSQLHGSKRDGDPTKPDREEFVQTTVERLMILNKSPEKIESQFKFRWTIQVLPLLEDLARDQAAARDIRVQNAVERQMVAEQSRLRRDLMIEQERTRQEELKEFWAEVKGGLREKLYLAMVDALASLERNQNLPPANIGALRRILETVSKLKFWDDEDLDAQMGRVRLLISASEATSTPDTSLMSEVMRSIGAQMRLQMLDLDYRPQRESRAGRKTGPDVGIPDTRDGLDFVINRGWRETRVVVADEPENDDNAEITVSRQSRSRTVADDEQVA